MFSLLRKKKQDLLKMFKSPQSQSPQTSSSGVNSVSTSKETNPSGGDSDTSRSSFGKEVSKHNLKDLILLGEYKHCILSAIGVTINASHCCIEAYACNIKADHCIIKGNNNTVTGSCNVVFGEQNHIYQFFDAENTFAVGMTIRTERACSNVHVKKSPAVHKFLHECNWGNYEEALQSELTRRFECLRGCLSTSAKMEGVDPVRYFGFDTILQLVRIAFKDDEIRGCKGLLAPSTFFNDIQKPLDGPMVFYDPFTQFSYALCSILSEKACSTQLETPEYAPYVRACLGRDPTYRSVENAIRHLTTCTEEDGVSHLVMQDLFSARAELVAWQTSVRSHELVSGEELADVNNLGCFDNLSPLEPAHAPNEPSGEGIREYESRILYAVRETFKASNCCIRAYGCNIDAFHCTILGLGNTVRGKCNVIVGENTLLNGCKNTYVTGMTARVINSVGASIHHRRSPAVHGLLHQCGSRHIPMDSTTLVPNAIKLLGFVAAMKLHRLAFEPISVNDCEDNRFPGVHLESIPTAWKTCIVAVNKHVLPAVDCDLMNERDCSKKQHVPCYIEYVQKHMGRNPTNENDILLTIKQAYKTLSNYKDLFPDREDALLFGCDDSCKHTPNPSTDSSPVIAPAILRIAAIPSDTTARPEPAPVYGPHHRTRSRHCLLREKMDEFYMEDDDQHDDPTWDPDPEDQDDHAMNSLFDPAREISSDEEPGLFETPMDRLHFSDGHGDMDMESARRIDEPGHVEIISISYWPPASMMEPVVHTSAQEPLSDVPSSNPQQITGAVPKQLPGVPRNSKHVIPQVLDEEALEGDLACKICYSNKTRIMIRPCNHLCMCRQCAVKLYENHDVLCPLCKRPIVEFFVVFT